MAPCNKCSKSKRCHKKSCCKCCKKTILDINFAKDGYNPDDFNVVFGNDGTTSTSVQGLTVTSVPFTSTIPVGNEHVKWLHYYKDTVTLDKCDETIYEGKIAVQQVLPSVLPSKFAGRVRNAQEDIRLCSAALNILDQETWMVYDFFMSNEKIYAFYERLPFGWPTQPFEKTYAAFSNCIEVASRAADPLNDFVTLAIGINTKKEYVKWYVNGKEVFKVVRPGLRLQDEYRMLEHGGPALKAEQKSISVGFGTFSLLDMALPYNYARQLSSGLPLNQAQSALVQLDLTSIYAELYPGPNGEPRDLIDPAQTFAYVLNEEPDDNRAVKLFGQGAILKVEYIKVFVVKC